MTKALKELIEKAPEISKGYFEALMIISNGKYDGFWGKNGYNNIMILGRLWGREKEGWYKISSYADKLSIWDLANGYSFNLDIPEQYAVPVIWFNRPIKIDYELPVSDVMGYIKDTKEVDINAKK